MAKENERVSFEQITNGYIINHVWHEGQGEKREYKTERTYYKTAKETSAALDKINKSILKNNTGGDVF